MKNEAHTQPIVPIPSILQQWPSVNTIDVTIPAVLIHLLSILTMESTNRSTDRQFQADNMAPLLNPGVPATGFLLYEDSQQ